MRVTVGRFLSYLVVAALVGCGSSSQATDGVGQAAPAYGGVLLDGDVFDLAAQRGDVVLINVWATWCQPCRQELPELARLHTTHTPERFRVVAISIDNENAEPKVRSLVRQLALPFPVVLDPRGHATGRFDVRVFPTSLLIDREGTVAWRRAGVIAPHDSELSLVLRRTLDARGPIH